MQIVIFLLIALFFCPFELVGMKPVTVIMGMQSQLDRPEGIDFSPKGNLLAVANSRSNAVSLYRRIGKKGARFEKTPSCVIQDDLLLKFVHEVRFSACGKYLAAISRDSHFAAIFKQSKTSSSVFESRPHCVIGGDDSLLNFPTSLSFVPEGYCLAICNRLASGITFHKQRHHSDISFDTVPYWHLSEEAFGQFHLAAPHGIAISRDGEFLAATHKSFYQNDMGTGHSALAIYRLGYEGGVTLQLPPLQVFNYDDTPLHSVAFHPSGNFLLVSNERAGVFLFQKCNGEFVQVKEIPIEVIQISQDFFEGPKGVAFSPTGDCLAITTVLGKVLLYPFDPDRK